MSPSTTAPPHTAPGTGTPPPPREALPRVTAPGVTGLAPQPRSPPGRRGGQRPPAAPCGRSNARFRLNVGKKLAVRVTERWDGLPRGLWGLLSSQPRLGASLCDPLWVQHRPVSGRSAFRPKLTTQKAPVTSLSFCKSRCCSY